MCSSLHEPLNAEDYYLYVKTAVGKREAWCNQFFYNTSAIHSF